MNKHELDAIRKRAQAATPGPWVAGRDAILMRPLYSFSIAVTREAYDKDKDPFTQWDHMADFIAHARDDVPALLAEVERLQEERDRFLPILADTTEEVERLRAALVRIAGSTYGYDSANARYIYDIAQAALAAGGEDD